MSRFIPDGALVALVDGNTRNWPTEWIKSGELPPAAFQISAFTPIAQSRLRAGVTLVVVNAAACLEQLRTVANQKEIPLVICNAGTFKRPVCLPSGPHGLDASHLSGPFDLIGDIHGCYNTLIAKLDELGYNTDSTSETYLLHPQGRLWISLGDLVDKGPHSIQVLRLALEAQRRGAALFLRGNHEAMLYGALTVNSAPNKSASTVSELFHQPDSAKLIAQVRSFLRRLPHQLILDGGRLIAVHAEITTEYVANTDATSNRKTQAKYSIGSTSSQALRTSVYGTKQGRRERDWVSHYQGSATIVHGHAVNKQVEVVDNSAGGQVVSLDTGAYAGNGLASFAWPENTSLMTPTSGLDLKNGALRLKVPASQA